MSQVFYRLQVKLFGQRGRESAPVRRTPILAGSALAATLACAGCSSSAPVPVPPPAAKATPSANVNVDEAWKDAQAVAAREPGSMAVVGSGSSMKPVYGDNTMLVIRPIAYEDLRVGMAVAYLNRHGLRVVHRLVERTPDGWRVKGLNNEQIDAEFVTRRNLIGVVYASFNYEPDETPGKK